jgi:hypothetical protein
VDRERGRGGGCGAHRGTVNGGRQRRDAVVTCRRRHIDAGPRRDGVWVAPRRHLHRDRLRPTRRKAVEGTRDGQAPLPALLPVARRHRDSRRARILVICEGRGHGSRSVIRDGVVEDVPRSIRHHGELHRRRRRLRGGGGHRRPVRDQRARRGGRGRTAGGHQSWKNRCAEKRPRRPTATARRPDPVHHRLAPPLNWSRMDGMSGRMTVERSVRDQSAGRRK